MNEKIDLFNPGVVMAFIAAALSDFTGIFLIGIAIPGIGITIGAAFAACHYIAAGIVGAFFWHKTRGWLAKLALGLAILLPLPLLTLGIILGIIFSNKIAALLGEQIIILGIAAATAGAGTALEAGAVAEAGTEGAIVAGEAATEGVAAG